MSKKLSRIRRAKRTRFKIRELNATRLCVLKTPRHVYAQLTTADGAQTLASASTLDKELRKKLKATSNVEAAKEVAEEFVKHRPGDRIGVVIFSSVSFTLCPVTTDHHAVLSHRRRWALDRVLWGIPLSPDSVP